MLSKNTRYLWGSDVRKNLPNAFFIVTNKYNWGVMNNPNKLFFGLANPILTYFISPCISNSIVKLHFTFIQLPHSPTYTLILWSDSYRCSNESSKYETLSRIKFSHFRGLTDIYKSSLSVWLGRLERRWFNYKLLVWSSISHNFQVKCFRVFKSIASKPVFVRLWVKHVKYASNFLRLSEFELVFSLLTFSCDQALFFQGVKWMRIFFAHKLHIIV